MGIHFEYTVHVEPQQTEHSERIFTTLFNGVCAMLNGGKYSLFLRNRLWAEAGNMTNLLFNNLFTSIRDFNPFQQFWGREE